MQVVIRNTPKTLFFLSFLIAQIHCAKTQQPQQKTTSPQVARPTSNVVALATQTVQPIAPVSMATVTIPIPEQQKSLVIQNGHLASIITFKDGKPQEHKWTQPVKPFVIANANSFVLYGDDKVFYIYDTASEDPQKGILAQLQPPFDVVALSDRGDYLAVTDSNKNLSLYHVQSTKRIPLPSIPQEAEVISLQFSKDSTKLAIAYRSPSWNGITEGSHSMVLYSIAVVSLNNEAVSPLNEFNAVSYMPRKDPCTFTSQNYVLKCPRGRLQYLSIMNLCRDICESSLVSDSKFPRPITGAFMNTNENELLVIGQDKPTERSPHLDYKGVIYSFDGKKRTLTNPKTIAISDTISVADFPLLQWSPKGDSLIASVGDHVYQMTLGKAGVLHNLGSGLSKAGFALASPHEIYGVSDNSPGTPIKKSKAKSSPWKAISQAKKGPSIRAFLPSLSPDLASIFTNAQKIVYISPKQQYVLTRHNSLFVINSSTPELLFADALTFALSDDQKRLFIVGKNNMMKVQEVGTTVKKGPNKPTKKPAHKNQHSNA